MKGAAGGSGDSRGRGIWEACRACRAETSEPREFARGPGTAAGGRLPGVPHLAQPADPLASAHSLLEGAAFLLAVKFENSAPHPHVSGTYPRAPGTRDQSLENIGGPSPTYWTARSELRGSQYFGKQYDADMDFTKLEGFFLACLFLFFCEAWGRGPRYLLLGNEHSFSGRCWNPSSPALPDILFKLSLSLGSLRALF